MNEIDSLKEELRLQKKLAYTAGMLQGDVTARALLESLSDGIVIIDADGRIILINTRMEELFGYTRDEAFSHKLDIYLPSHVQDRHNKHVKGFFDNPKVRPMGIGVELFGVTKEKKQIPVEISISFLKTDFGLLGLAFVTDIRVRKKIELELLDRNRALNEFSQIVAHDLNSNINGIVGSSQLLLHQPSELSEHEKREFLEIIMKSGQKMSDVIRELLLFATMKKGEVKSQLIEMRPVIDEALMRLSDNIKERNAQITVQESLDGAVGYGPWVEEIWLNFLSNALKYGGTPPIIEIISQKIDGNIEYSVSDNGPGLSQEDLETILSDRHEGRMKIIKGHGLGLEIAFKILEKLDGTLKLSTSKWGGCKFSFTLPIKTKSN